MLVVQKCATSVEYGFGSLPPPPTVVVVAVVVALDSGCFLAAARGIGCGLLTPERFAAVAAALVSAESDSLTTPPFAGNTIAAGCAVVVVDYCGGCD